MQAIKPYTQVFDDVSNPDILKKIELCGRVCYKSEAKIKDGSAEKFVSALIKRGHEAVLEHGSFIFKLSEELYTDLQKGIIYMEDNSEFKSFLRFTHDKTPIVSGNVRAWRSFFKAHYEMANNLPLVMKDFIQNNPILFPEFQDVGYIRLLESYKMVQITTADLETELEKLVHHDVTVKFVVDRGITHEIVRHRPASYCQESTRYCNYSKDDFGSEITVIIPPYLDYKSAAWNAWVEAMKNAEKSYFELLNIGLTAQEARTVLPTGLKTELVMTANLAEWKWFFELRTAPAAHPQIVEVAKPLLDEMNELFPNIFDKVGEIDGKQK